MYDMEVDPEREVTVTCGGTEAMAATFLALIDPGDEVIIPEPFYENYGPDGILAGARPVFVPLDPPGWASRTRPAARAFTSRTRAFVLNSPHNPTGRVFTRDEICSSRPSAIEHDVMVITDESVRVHHLRRQAPPDRDVARHARADRHDIQSVQDVQLHRLAARLRDRTARDDGRDPQGPRFPHRGRARAKVTATPMASTNGVVGNLPLLALVGGRSARLLGARHRRAPKRVQLNPESDSWQVPTVASRGRLTSSQ